MSTENARRTNAGNAKKSTGPRSAGGKAKAAQNALAHGLCSAQPVLPGESADVWERHRAGVAAALTPVGGLEDALAERVAVCLWRLRRVVAYETAVTVAAIDEAADPPAPVDDPFDQNPSDAARLYKAEKELAEVRGWLADGERVAELLQRVGESDDDAEPVAVADVEAFTVDLNDALPNSEDEYFDFEDQEFLAEFGLPPEYVDNPFEWPGWTLGYLRKAVRTVAEDFDITPSALVARARTGRARQQDEYRETEARLRAEVAELRPRVEATRRRALVRRAVPDAGTLDKLCRYEAHLSRQMLQSLHTLERLQAARAGREVPPPAAVDVTLDMPVGG